MKGKAIKLLEILFKNVTHSLLIICEYTLNFDVSHSHLLKIRSTVEITVLKFKNNMKRNCRNHGGN